MVWQRIHGRYVGFLYLVHQLCARFAVWLYKALPKAPSSMMKLFDSTPVQTKEQSDTYFNQKNILLNSVALKAHTFLQYARPIFQSPKAYMAC